MPALTRKTTGNSQTSGTLSAGIFSARDGLTFVFDSYFLAAEPAVDPVVARLPGPLRQLEAPWLR